MNNKQYYLELQNYTPKTAGIITTYKCNAQCSDCCFNCSPHETESLSFKDIVNFIDELSSIKTINSIVWTGGECTLLNKTLEDGMKYAFSKGFNSRIVSNGIWATTTEKSIRYLKKLKAYGLIELNLSTGDNHINFVSVNKIMTASYAAISIGIRVLVSIEKTKHSNFTKTDIEKHPLFEKIKENKFGYLFSSLSSPWISFGEDSYEYDRQAFLEKNNGCDNLFNFIGVNPNKEILSCCGLTVRYMPEMKTKQSYAEDLLSIYNSQKTNFMKQWLFVSGPINILQQVKQWDNSIEIPDFVHPCQACAYIFQNTTIVETISINYKQISQKVSQDFLQKISFNKLFEEKLNK